MQPVIKVFLTGAILVLGFDTVGASASRLLGFPYAVLWIGSFIVYLAVTCRAAVRSGLLAAIAVGALLGLVDSTLGWAISWAIGPGRPTEPMTSAAIGAAILFVVALGAAWGLLGGIAARSVVGKATAVALVAVAGLVQVRTSRVRKSSISCRSVSSTRCLSLTWSAIAETGSPCGS